MKRKPILTGLAALGAILLGIYGWQQYSLKFPNREHPMTPLTQNMKTVCVGRYLVDVPQEAEIAFSDINIEGIRISHTGIVPGEVMFRDKVKQREAELRAAKHDTEGTRLREAVDINGGKQRLLAYREDQKYTLLTWVEAAVLTGNHEWLINFEAADEDVVEVKSFITKLANHLRYRDPQEIPTEPGNCIENGFVAGSDYQNETLPVTFWLKKYSTSINIMFETSGQGEKGQTLWDRIGRAHELSKEFFGEKAASEKIIRHAEVKVDGRSGQEHIEMTTFTDKRKLIADAEIYGDGTIKIPTLKLSLRVTYPHKPDASSGNPPLTQDEALVLWDAFIKSIRPRPGAF